MTGQADQGDRPARSPTQQRAAGPEHAARASTTTSSTGRSASPSRCRSACGPRWPTPGRRSTAPAAAAGLPPADRPPDDPLAGPVLPGSRRQLQAVQDRLAAPGRGRPAARGPAGLLRGRPDHDRPLPRRRQPVRQRRRPGGPVQDQLQHLDRRPGGGQGDAAGLRQHRRGRRARTRGRPTSRPATSRPRTGSSRSRPTATVPPDADQRPADARPGRRRRPPPNVGPEGTVPPLPAPVGPLGPPPTPAAADGPGRRGEHPVVASPPPAEPDGRPARRARSNPGRRRAEPRQRPATPATMPPLPVQIDLAASAQGVRPGRAATQPRPAPGPGPRTSRSRPRLAFSNPDDRPPLQRRRKSRQQRC